MTERSDALTMSRSLSLSDVWVIQEEYTEEEKSRWMEPQKFKLTFGNVIYVAYSEEEIVLKAISLYLERIDSEANKNLVSMRFTPNVTIDGPNDLAYYNELTIYEMIKSCTEIGEKASPLKATLKTRLAKWNADKEGGAETWCILATFAQKMLEAYPDQFEPLINAI
ncbi:MAG: hypothetical protein EOP45_21960 [Sphingobacteriaceae bacterium]|nr:MAG: hypothetical protein EOP45_21960 [Sphingobacteriaceae bacterium]